MVCSRHVFLFTVGFGIGRIPSIPTYLPTYLPMRDGDLAKGDENKKRVLLQPKHRQSWQRPTP